MQCFGIADEGSRPTVRTGEVFELALPETPTTGYRWAITEVTGPLLVIDDAFSPPESVIPGAGGTHRWRLRPEHAGPGALRAELTRRSDPTPGRSFDLTIEIAAAQRSVTDR
jgi:inhibitor of cysteine peptidase